MKSLKRVSIVNMKDKTCSKTGKTAYKNEAIAKSELAFCEVANIWGNDTYKQIRHYKCEFCDMYHLTSQEDKFAKNNSE